MTTEDVDEVERRLDGPVETIDEAVVLATVEGVGPAIEHMSQAGVEHKTALRVLAAPQYHRVVKPGTLPRVLHFVAARMSRKRW